MTRDEEIYNAINNLQIGVYDENMSSDNDEYNNDEYDGSDIQNAFMQVQNGQMKILNCHG